MSGHPCPDCSKVCKTEALLTIHRVAKHGARIGPGSKPAPPDKAPERRAARPEPAARQARSPEPDDDDDPFESF